MSFSFFRDGESEGNSEGNEKEGGEIKGFRVQSKLDLLEGRGSD